MRVVGLIRRGGREKTCPVRKVGLMREGESHQAMRRRTCLIRKVRLMREVIPIRRCGGENLPCKESEADERDDSHQAGRRRKPAM